MAPNLHDVEAYIFDLDGTLADTLADIGIAANVVLTGRGFPAFPLVRYREFVGAGGEVLLRRAFAAAEGHSADLPPRRPRRSRNSSPNTSKPTAIRNTARRASTRASANSSPRLRKAAAASPSSPTNATSLRAGSSPRSSAKSPLPKSGASARAYPASPTPTSALRIAEIIGISPGRIAFVGDSGVDMRTARASHMHAIGVNWGFRPREELVAEGALAILEHPRELLGLAGLSA